MASKYHPDRFTGDEAKKNEELFKEAKEAYEVLSDPSRRQVYDVYGHSNSQGASYQHQQNPNTSTWIFEQGEDALQEIFKNIFRQNSFDHGNQPQRQQIHLVTINLADAYVGKAIKIDNLHTVNIPAGVRSGTKFFIDNKLFRIDIAPHPKFKRSNDDLLLDIEISAIEAMLGTNAVLEHLDGVKLQFTIPPGIQHGQIIRLSSKGMKNPEVERVGDALVRISIKIPQGLTDTEKEALKVVTHRSIIDI